MTKKEINDPEQANYPGGLWINLAVGLMLLVGTIALGGCGQNSADGKAKPSAGTIVKNSIGVEFAYVPAGSFQMGSDKPVVMEHPAHQVTFARGFYLGRYEVTQAQWQKVMGSNPEFETGCGENCPVKGVSWNGAQEFIKKLNAINDGYTYRLPSEAEWEYACRAGTTSDYAGEPDSIAWYDKNSGSKEHPVGQKQPNAWGLYDMHGNVAEWVMDNFHPLYDGAPTDGSAWVSGGEPERVTRGGSYGDSADFIRSSRRPYLDPKAKVLSIGFRVAAVARS